MGRGLVDPDGEGAVGDHRLDAVGEDHRIDGRRAGREEADQFGQVRRRLGAFGRDRPYLGAFDRDHGRLRLWFRPEGEDEVLTRADHRVPAHLLPVEDRLGLGVDVESVAVPAAWIAETDISPTGSCSAYGPWKTRTPGSAGGASKTPPPGAVGPKVSRWGRVFSCVISSLLDSGLRLRRSLSGDARVHRPLHSGGEEGGSAVAPDRGHPGSLGEFQMFAGVGRVKPVDDRADLRVEGAKHSDAVEAADPQTGSFNAPRLPRRLLHREVDDARGEEVPATGDERALDPTR